MKKTALVLGLALAVTMMGMSLTAWAGEQGSCCAAKATASAGKTCPMSGDKAAAGKTCPMGEKATLTGKVEARTEKVDGKDVQLAYLNVSACKSADGKSQCDMAGKSVKLTGEKAGEAAKLAGKDVEVTGVCKDGKEVEVASVAVKEQPKA